MRLHLHGNGAARTPTIPEDLAMIRAAGFEVKEHFDFANLGKQVTPKSMRIGTHKHGMRNRADYSKRRCATRTEEANEVRRRVPRE